MISRKNYLLIVLVLSLVCRVVCGEIPNISERNLNFESSEETMPWSEAWEGFGIIKPTHVATLTMKKDKRNYDPRQTIDFIKKYKDEKLLSQEQWDFIKQKHYYYEYTEQGLLKHEHDAWSAINSQKVANMALVSSQNNQTIKVD